MTTVVSRRTLQFGVSAAIALTGGAVLLRLGTSGLSAEGLSGAVRDFFTLSISVLIESLPFVFLGILLSIVVQIWLPPTLFDALLPRRPVLRRAVMSLLGILLPVCECGNVPLARGLIIRGMTVAESITFLLAAPILNPVTIITTYQAFGWDDGILVCRIVGGFVLANLIGWMFSRHPRQHELLTPSFEASCSADHGPDRRSRLHRSVVAFAAESSAMLPALIVGCAVAGLIQVGFPREMLVALGGNPLWSVLALVALAFVISICSNVDAFFILALSSLFLPGGIIAFLIFGAMVDVKMLALLRTTFTTATLVRVTVIVGLFSIALGFGVNLVV